MHEETDLPDLSGSALSTHHSPLTTDSDSPLRTHHSGLTTQDSALSTQYPTLSTHVEGLGPIGYTAASDLESKPTPAIDCSGAAAMFYVAVRSLCGKLLDSSEVRDFLYGTRRGALPFRST